MDPFRRTPREDGWRRPVQPSRGSPGPTSPPSLVTRCEAWHEGPAATVHVAPPAAVGQSGAPTHGCSVRARARRPRTRTVATAATARDLQAAAAVHPLTNGLGPPHLPGPYRTSTGPAGPLPTAAARPGRAGAVAERHAVAEVVGTECVDGLPAQARLALLPL